MPDEDEQSLREHIYKEHPEFRDAPEELYQVIRRIMVLTGHVPPHLKKHLGGWNERIEERKSQQAQIRQEMVLRKKRYKKKEDTDATGTNRADGPTD